MPSRSRYRKAPPQVEEIVTARTIVIRDVIYYRYNRPGDPGIFNMPNERGYIYGRDGQFAIDVRISARVADELKRRNEDTILHTGCCLDTQEQS